MTYTDFEEIERIHSQWSMLDKISKMAYLRNEYQRLESIAYQFGFYLKSKGGYITDEERKLLQYLVEMMDSIKSEEEKIQAEFNNEWWNEWRKEVAKVIFRTT